MSNQPGAPPPKSVFDCVNEVFSRPGDHNDASSPSNNEDRDVAIVVNDASAQRPTSHVHPSGNPSPRTSRYDFNNEEDRPWGGGGNKASSAVLNYMNKADTDCNATTTKRTLKIWGAATLLVVAAIVAFGIPGHRAAKGSGAAAPDVPTDHDHDYSGKGAPVGVTKDEDATANPTKSFWPTYEPTAQPTYEPTLEESTPKPILMACSGAGVGKKMCNNMDHCQWTGSSCVTTPTPTATPTSVADAVVDLIDAALDAEEAYEAAEDAAKAEAEKIEKNEFELKAEAEKDKKEAEKDLSSLNIHATGTAGHFIMSERPFWGKSSDFHIKFQDKSPGRHNWIAIAKAGSMVDEHLVSDDVIEAWSFACGQPDCSEAVPAGSVTFKAGSTPPGLYQAFLCVWHEDPPYKVKASSDAFVLGKRGGGGKKGKGDDNGDDGNENGTEEGNGR